MLQNHICAGIDDDGQLVNGRPSSFRLVGDDEGMPLGAIRLVAYHMSQRNVDKVRIVLAMCAHSLSSCTY